VTRVGFVVNGGRDSAMGRRARAFAERLAREFTIDVTYREPGRLPATLAFRAALRRARPALTYVFDHALPGVLAAAWHKRASGNRLILDTGDAIAALARSLGRGPLALALTGWLERFGYRAADHVVVRGTRHQEWLSGQGIASTVIPDGVETDRFAPRDAAGLRRRLGLEGVLAIGLIGSSTWSQRLGTCYGWDLVELIHLLRDAPVAGVLIGDGSGIPRLQARVAELGIRDRVRFPGRVRRSSSPRRCWWTTMARWIATIPPGWRSASAGCWPIPTACATAWPASP
jgi:glycosyltransferase involved in cell wall biosynthesis